MICSKCGKDNPDGSWACGICGEPLKEVGPAQEQPGAQPYPGQPQQPPAAGPYPAQQQPPGAPQQKSGKGSLVVKLLMALLVVVIIAVPAWYFLSREPDPSTPSGTVETYLKAISDKDCKKLYDLSPNEMVKDVSDEDIDNCSMFMGLFDFKFSDYKAIDESIDGDTATVDFEVTMEMGSLKTTQQTTASLIKEDGVWKVESGSGLS